MTRSSRLLASKATSHGEDRQGLSKPCLVAGVSIFSHCWKLEVKQNCNWDLWDSTSQQDWDSGISGSNISVGRMDMLCSFSLSSQRDHSEEEGDIHSWLCDAFNIMFVSSSMFSSTVLVTTQLGSSFARRDTLYSSCDFRCSVKQIGREHSSFC